MKKLVFIILLLFSLISPAFAEQYEILLSKQAAETYRVQVQAILEAQKGNYSGNPWIIINVFPLYDGRWAVPIPEQVEIESLGVRVADIPKPPKEEQMGED